MIDLMRFGEATQTTRWNLWFRDVGEAACNEVGLHSDTAFWVVEAERS